MPGAGAVHHIKSAAANRDKSAAHVRSAAVIVLILMGVTAEKPWF